MSYRGTGAPQFGTEAATYTMPRPVKGGRTEKFEPIQQIYENIINKLIPGERVLRFSGEYEFSIVPIATLNLLMNVHNFGRIMMWAPHSDINKIRYAVVVDNFEIIPVNGLIDYDGVKLSVRAVDTVNSIPNPDNWFRLGHRFPYLAALAVVTAGNFVATTTYSIRTVGNTNYITVAATLTTAGAFGVGTRYIIKDIGTTDYTLIGANQFGAPDIIKGVVYKIDSVGDTDWTNLGAVYSNVGIEFIASWAGTPNPEAGTTGTCLGANFVATGVGAGTGRSYESAFTASGVGSGTGTVIERE